MHFLIRHFPCNFRAISAMIIYASFLMTHCKPLQQQSNDRLSMNRDRSIITDAYDVDSLTGSDSDIRLAKLSRTMDALTQFREMLNNRLLVRSSIHDRSSSGDNLDIMADDSSLVRVENADGLIPLTNRNQYKQHKNEHYHHKRKHQSSVDNKVYQRKQRGDESELQSNTYQIHGLQIKAHLQPDSQPANKNSGGGGQSMSQDEQKERFMTGKTTTIDEQQLRLLSQFPQTDFECPRLNGKTTQVLCPSRRRHGYRVCIPDTALCNDEIDCPNGEDEDPVNCLFYKTTIHHFRLVVDAVVELSDLVKQQERRRNSDEL